ncbi:Hypothetical protein ACI5QL_00139 [Bacillus velezensis]|uniref:Uncharacterized protein n=1 Tax=Bacillus amyloliquefaciens (strain Y2) TaxID=1155777 RepID=I2C0P1_BACAY|nr:hypothetical protein MUS_0127 [Bacillus velezensis YAU B9601-Y2]
MNGLNLDGHDLYLFDAMVCDLRRVLQNDFLLCEILDVRKLFA